MSEEVVASSGSNAAVVDPAAAKKSTSAGGIVDVTIHPLVLLSAADHYHRVARGTRKRVVGALLGQVIRGSAIVTNSFAVPFEEDSRNPAVFYFDHNYLENMLYMFRKVNSKERVVGFYSTGPQIRPNDLRIYDVVDRFVRGPSVFCIIDIRPDRPDLPVTAYKVVEEVGSSSGGGGSGGSNQQQQLQVQRSFAHVPSQMGAEESEEIGVEHLLRDINDPTVSTVATLIRGKMSGLATLVEKLVECKDYLETVAAAAGDEDSPIRPSEEIVANLQTILNLLPNLNTPDLVRSMIVKTNDMYMAVYLAALIRSVIALHDVVNNKIRYGEDGMERPLDGEGKDGSKGASKKEEEEKKDEKGENDKNKEQKNDKDKKKADSKK